MFAKLTRRAYYALGALSCGLAFQSTCPLDPEFDSLALFAEATSTLITDTIFFALDSLLVSFA